MTTRSQPHRLWFRRATLLTLAGTALLPLAACDDGRNPAAAAAATELFCDSAEQARDAGDQIDVLGADPQRLESDVNALLIRYETVLDRAPVNFRGTAKALVEQQRRGIDLLTTFGWDALAAFNSPEGQELAADPTFDRVQAERDAYLLDYCQLEPNEDTTNGVQLVGGEDGIRQVLLLLQAAGWVIDLEQTECVVDGLVGKIGDDDVAAFANSQTVSEAGKLLINVVFSDCEIVVPE